VDMIRKTSVAGSFYPDSKEEIEKYIHYFHKLHKKHHLIRPSSMVIVPHAGYIYSGFTAHLAYKALAQSTLKTVVVIGPSHRVAFDGISVGQFEVYQTPLGEVQGEMDLSTLLQNQFNLPFYDVVHAEHSTEVQFPFIKYYLPDVRMVELVYGHESPLHLGKIIKFLMNQEGVGLIISTDLSHFYTLDEAKQKDAHCLEAITKNHVIDNLCEACGKIGVEALLMNTKTLKSEILDYRTSADASGDNSRVVGYVSALFY
jgi:AmmeMemoRadiSam system protein B